MTEISREQLKDMDVERPSGHNETMFTIGRSTGDEYKLSLCMEAFRG